MGLFNREKIQRSTEDRLAVPLTLGTAFMSFFDFMTHPNGVNNGAHAFKTLEREAQKIDPTERYLLGQTIGDHSGNFGLSAAVMIPFTAASEMLKIYAQKKESKVLEFVANTIPYLGFLTVAWLNFSVENFYDEKNIFNVQFTGDMLFGLGAAIFANYATAFSIRRFQNASKVVYDKAWQVSTNK